MIFCELVHGEKLMVTHHMLLHERSVAYIKNGLLEDRKTRLLVPIEYSQQHTEDKMTDDILEK